MITKPNRNIVDAVGRTTTPMMIWMEQITNLQIVEGAGSPEGVFEALQKIIYMDTAGTTGNILYIKRDADIAGDKSKGWILI